MVWMSRTCSCRIEKTKIKRKTKENVCEETNVQRDCQERDEEKKKGRKGNRGEEVGRGNMAYIDAKRVSVVRLDGGVETLWTRLDPQNNAELDQGVVVLVLFDDELGVTERVLVDDEMAFLSGQTPDETKLSRCRGVLAEGAHHLGGWTIRTRQLRRLARAQSRMELWPSLPIDLEYGSHKKRATGY